MIVMMIMIMMIMLIILIIITIIIIIAIIIIIIMIASEKLACRGLFFGVFSSLRRFVKCREGERARSGLSDSLFFLDNTPSP